MIDEFSIVLQNQIDALEHNQFDFLLYDRGSGGEFLSALISKYSPRYNYSMTGSVLSTGRHRLDLFFLANVFSGGIPNQTILTDTIDLELLLDINKKWNGKYLREFELHKQQYLDLDRHLCNGGRVLVRAQAIHRAHMTAAGTYFLYCDTPYWESYRSGLCRAKLSCTAEECAPKVVHEDISEYQKLYHSSLIYEGFLEWKFDIDDPQFRVDLMDWYANNMKILEQ